jgi:hypothetical protein
VLPRRLNVTSYCSAGCFGVKSISLFLLLPYYFGVAPYPPTNSSGLSVAQEVLIKRKQQTYRRDDHARLVEAFISATCIEQSRRG